MLSEDLKNKRADVSNRLMDKCITLLEKCDEPTKEAAELAEVLARFISNSYAADTQSEMVEQLKSAMRKAGHDIGRLD